MNKMDEFEKIKTFSESLVEREQKINETQTQPNPKEELSLPQYLSQFRAVPVAEQKEPKTILWIALGLAVIIAGGTIFALTHRAPKMEESKIVVISPTPTPVKVLPENPGGLDIPDKDKVVYNRAELAPTPVVENLFPEPEQPILPTEVILPETKEGMTVAPPKQVSQEVSFEQPTQELKQVSESTLAVPSQKREEKGVESVKSEKKKATPIAKEKQIIWRAQLLSSSSKAKVETSWQTISKNHKALLSDMPYQIVSAEIAGKGIFWRLQVGEFATREMVMNLCEKLKKKKQECIPVK